MRVQTFSPYFQINILIMLTALIAGAVLPFAGGQIQLSPAIPLTKQSLDRIQASLSFEANEGQTDSSVEFLTHSLGGTLFFRRGDVVLSLPTGFAQAPSSYEDGSQLSRTIQQHTPLQLNFLNTNPNTLLVGIDQQVGIVNYLTGNDPAYWQTNVPTYGGLRYEQLYPGIDLYYEGTNGQLKGTYFVAPGADPARIRWQHKGADAVNVDPSTGELRIQLAASTPITLIEQAPVAWQELGGRRVPVEARYITEADGSVHFALGSYDSSHALVIDPTLTYSSYLGGNSADYAYDIAVDSQGNFYVTGATGSTDFPLANPVQSSPSPFGDVFVTKFTAGGATLAYSTYLGGNDSDVGFGIGVDGAGNAYVTGESWSNNFPVVNPILPNNPGIQQDVIVFKLNPAGNTLLYSTYLGGFNSQTARGIALDAAGNAYITGHTLSPNFPVVNPIQSQRKGVQDAFVSKINPTGSALVYSTFLGSSGSLDYGFGIALDSAGNAYVTGQTTENDFPTANALQPAPGGFGEAFVSKINANGTALVYSTYLGGEVNDRGTSIAVDSAGNVYVTGPTESTNFPTANAFQPVKNGYEDAFVTKINAAGSALVYSTFLGGSVPDCNYDCNIAADSAGNAYVAGNTQSLDFPTVNAVQPIFGGYDSDAFVAKFNPQGSALLYSTYLGGSAPGAGLGDYAYGLALDGNGNAYVTGYTFAPDFPLAGSSYQTTNRGNYDAFVAVINDQPAILPTFTPSPTPTLTPTPNPQLTDFALEVSPTSQTVKRQQTASYSIRLTALNGFSGNVQLSVSGVPPRTNAVFTNNPVTLGPNSTVQFSRLDVTPRRNAPTSTFTLTITATGGGKTHSQTVTLTITR